MLPSDRVVFASMTSIALSEKCVRPLWVVAVAATLAVLLLATLLPSSARAQGPANVVGAINAARAAARCAPASPDAPAATAASGSTTPTPAPGLTAPPLKSEPLLDAAAAELAQAASSVGRPLTEVLLANGYRATRSMVIQVTGAASGAALARFVEQRYCAQLVSVQWQEIGFYQRSSANPGGMTGGTSGGISGAASGGTSAGALQVQTWLVLASRFAPPAPEQANAIGQRVLELVNLARAQPRTCGTQAFAAAGPLRWNDVLARAGHAHSTDMAAHSYFSHDGRDGSKPAQCATRAGYHWRAAGENIAGGQTTAEAAVQGWIDSPPHCANLMGAQFTEMGVAFAVNPQSKLGIYWTQMFGTPR